MSRHGMKYCLLCNPDGNGSSGEQGTEAVGKYYLPKGPGQCFSGWIPVCEGCSEAVNQYFHVEFFDGKTPEWKRNEIKDAEDKRYLLYGGKHHHEWHKVNLVTLEENGHLFDEFECTKCGARIKAHLRNQPPESGCTIEDEATREGAIH